VIYLDLLFQETRYPVYIIYARTWEVRMWGAWYSGLEEIVRQHVCGIARRIKAQSTDCTLTLWSLQLVRYERRRTATLGRSKARERKMESAGTSTRLEWDDKDREIEMRLERGEMTTSPFPGCHKVNCLFYKVKERWIRNVLKGSEPWQWRAH